MYADIIDNDETVVLSNDTPTKISPVKSDSAAGNLDNTNENTLTEAMNTTLKETLENKSISHLQLKDEVFKVCYFSLLSNLQLSTYY